MTDLVLEQRIEASPAEVYRYLTESDRWKRWQGADATLDARVGGVLSVLMANGMNALGEFVELVPHRRVVFTWGWVGWENLPPGSSTVEIELRADGDTTILVLTHRSIPDDEVASQRAGWIHYLPRLASAAAGQDPGADTTPGDDFAAFLERQAEAEAALVQGDVEPRLALWSRRDPVSLLGAWGPNKTGWEELERTFRWVAERLGQGRYSDFRYDVEVADVSADGQMAFTVGFERFTEHLADGGTKPWTVRVTHAYRREDGEWRIVHRHGDLAPLDESPPG